MTRQVKKRVKRATPLEANRRRLQAWVDEVGVVEVGRLLGCGAPHVSRLQKGTRGCSGELAARMQRLRGIPSVDWFEGSEE